MHSDRLKVGMASPVFSGTKITAKHRNGDQHTKITTHRMRGAQTPPKKKEEKKRITRQVHLPSGKEETRSLLTRRMVREWCEWWYGGGTVVVRWWMLGAMTREGEEEPLEI